MSLAELPIASLLVNKSGKILNANSLFDDMRGVPHGESIHRSANEILNSGINSPLALIEHFEGNVNTQTPKPYYLRCHEGKDLLVDILVKGFQEHYVLTVLPHSDFFEQHYSAAKEKSYRVGQYKYDVVNNEYFFSPGLQMIYGVNKPHNEIILKDFFDKHPTKEKVKLKRLPEEALSANNQFAIKTYFISDKEKRVWLDIKGVLTVDSEHNITEINAIVRDITVEHLLIEKLKLLVMFKNAVNVPVYFLDENDQKVFPELSLFDSQPDGLFSYVNFNIADYISLKEQALKYGQFHAKDISFDKYNTVYNISVTFEPHERLFVWVVENVTEQYFEQQQQAISNRLTLLGNAFSNVSHDINNVLSIALGSIELLEIKVEAGQKDDLTPYIERVKNAIDKGRHVTDRLLAFTRKPAVKMVEFNPEVELKENLYIFDQLLDEKIKLSVSFSEKQYFIRFPQGEFINIVLNIVINAQDAIFENSNKGRIELSTNIDKGNRFQLIIKDSGVGIQEENLKKIFDPFFTNKSSKQGNGIGLANVYNTMYKHNGSIQVDGKSDLGGAQFTLTFKCKPAEEKPKTPLGINKYNKLKGLNILAIDSEVSIVDFVDVCLSEEGANVTKINHLDELQRDLVERKTLDMVITDLNTPISPNDEIIKLIQAKFPTVTVLSMSGYIESAGINWPYPILRKPFSFKELKEFIVSNVGVCTIHH